MANYKIGEASTASDGEDFQVVLGQAYAKRIRPLCTCQPGGIEMYISRIDGGIYVVKRMPGTGHAHSPNCVSHEPPADLSGLGEVLGSAIKEDLDGGPTVLKLDFPLSKRSGKAATAEGDGGGDTVRTDGAKLTLRGVFHYLWEQAGFARWSPKMTGKRNWAVIKHHLQQAARGMANKGAGFDQTLFVPEPFSADRKDEIARVHAAALAPLRAPAEKGKPQALKILIGEMKALEPGRFGGRLIIKHLPDMPFRVPTDLLKRLQKKFEAEMALHEVAAGHLLVVATFGLDPQGVATIEKATLVVLNAAWLPIETMYDKILLDELIAKNRRFTRALRYNLPPDAPIATAITHDTQPNAVAMYVIPPASGRFLAELSSIVTDSLLPSWFWQVDIGPVPELPSFSGFIAHTMPDAAVASSGAPAPQEVA